MSINTSAVPISMHRHWFRTGAYLLETRLRPIGRKGSPESAEFSASVKPEETVFRLGPIDSR